MQEQLLDLEAFAILANYHLIEIYTYMCIYLYVFSVTYDFK